MRSIIKILAISSAVLAAMASCTEKAEIDDYINLSISGYVFEATGSDSIVVGVKTNAGDWSVSSDASFIEVGEQRDDSVTIKAVRNMEDKTLSGSVTFTAGSAVKVLNVSQLPASFRGFVKVLPMTARGTMSRNGEWFGWVDTPLGEDNEWHTYGYLMNMKTKEIKEIPVPSLDQMDKNTRADEVAAISDDGRRMLVGTGNSIEWKYMVDGEIVPLGVPEGYDYCEPENFNADGTVVVGSVVKSVPGSTSIFHPCKWINGEPMVMEYSYEDAYGNYHDTGSMTYVRGCSADGTICYGSEWETQCLQYWEEDGTLHNIGMDNLEVSMGDMGLEGFTRLQLYAEFWNISNDGRYIVCEMASVGTGAAPTGLAVVDTKLGTYEVFENASGGNYITEDGLVFMGGTFNTIGVYDTNTGESLNFTEWMQAQWGVTPPASSWPRLVSYDLKSFAGRNVGSVGGTTQNGFWAMRVE